MCVDEVAHRIRSPRTDRADHRLTRVHARRIEGDHACFRLHRHAVAEALDYRETIVELAELVRDAVDGLIDDARIDDPRGEVEKVCHRAEP